MTGCPLEGGVQAHRLLAQAARCRCRVLFGGEMCGDAVRRAQAGRLARHKEPRLGHRLDEADPLDIGRLATPVGAGEDDDAAIGPEGNVVYHDGFSGRLQGEVEIVAGLHLTDPLALRGELGAANGESQLAQRPHQSDRAQVERQLSSQDAEEVPGEIDITFKRTRHRLRHPIEYASHILEQRHKRRGEPRGRGEGPAGIGSGVKRSDARPIVDGRAEQPAQH